MTRPPTHQRTSLARRILRWLLRGAVFIIALLLILLAWIYSAPFPQSALSHHDTTSLTIVDRHGEPLRDVLSEREGRAQWLALEDISPWLIAATLATEDHDFYDHVGVDPFAVARAAWDNTRHRRVVSGASTITMQVVRLIWPRPRTLRAKASEAFWALRLERTLSKDEILEHYLNRAPYGNQIFGVAAASRAYFDKPASQLSPAEAALLAGLPQSPTHYNPYRHLDRAKRRQAWVLQRMVREDLLTEAHAEQARHEPLRITPLARSFQAPHAVDLALQGLDDDTLAHATRMTLTLDTHLQHDVEGIVRSHVKRLRDHNVSNAAVVVLDNQTAEVVALVGSFDFFAHDIAGQYNGATALRQPGSTLKPLTYALGIEQGMTPATLLADIPTHYTTAEGSYQPTNFDNTFRGPVRLRDALAMSLNVPAVRVLDQLGVQRLLNALREMGFDELDQPANHYGLGLTLGGGEVRLIDLTAAFMMFARGGVWQAPQLIRHVEGPHHGWPPPASTPRRMISDVTSYLITDILADRHARAPVFGLHGPLSLPFEVAAKTGTSSDIHDIWTVGYTPRFTVGVWVGNFDNTPMHGLSGISGAGPIFHDVMMRLHEDGHTPWFTQPQGLETATICALSGMLPNEHCPHALRESFPKGHTPTTVSDMHRAVRIDRRNGLLATSTCPDEDVETRVLVYLPPQFEPWLHLTGRPLPPRDTSPLCPSPSTTASPQPHPPHRTPHPTWVQLTYPIDGSRFMIDPGRPLESQSLRFEAHAQHNVDRVRWSVDGHVLGQSARPFRQHWTLRRGHHRITATALRKGQVVDEHHIHIDVD